MTIDFERLAAPFPPDVVSWRVGSSNKKKRAKETGDNYAKATKGMALAYIDARDVMDRLDDVCGPGGWQCRYSHTQGKTVCEIGIQVSRPALIASESGGFQNVGSSEWVWKADGAGDTDHEAEKGALSDSFKRAAVRWGIGRYLYHIASPWVDLDEREQITAADQRKLEALLGGGGSKPVLPKSEPVTAKPVDDPKPKTLSERADMFEDVLRNTKVEDLPKAWAKGSQLCAQLDTAMPERLVELEELYKGLSDPIPFD